MLKSLGIPDTDQFKLIILIAGFEMGMPGVPLLIIRSIAFPHGASYLQVRNIGFRVSKSCADQIVLHSSWLAYRHVAMELWCDVA